jgi:hypothetical protein
LQHGRIAHIPNKIKKFFLHFNKNKLFSKHLPN